MWSVGLVKFYAKLYIYGHVSCFKGMILTKEGLKSTALKTGSSHYVFLMYKFLHWYLFLGVIVSKNLFIQSVGHCISFLLLL